MERRNYEFYRAVDRATTATQRAIFDAFNKDSRTIKTKVEIFFDGLNKPPYVTVPSDDELIDWQILEEIAQDSVHPVGSVLSNVLELSLLNVEDKFNPYNASGPWFGKIKEYLPIRIWVTEDSLLPDYIHMGTFYVANWKMQKSTNTVSVTAYNAFQQIISDEAPLIPMRQNISVGAFLFEFFRLLDVPLSHIRIEQKLYTMNMDNSYGLDGAASITLNTIAKAYLLYIWMDRDDIIHVQRIDHLKADNDFVITDEDQVLRIDMGYSITKQYSRVNVEYSIGRNIEYVELARLTDYPIKKGLNMLEKVKPTQSPVRSIETVAVKGSQPIKVQSFKCTPYLLWVYLTSEHPDETLAEISVQGTALLDGTYASYTVSEPSFNGKTLEVSNVYLEGANQAKELAETLLRYLMNDNAVCELDVRGTPALQIGSSASIDDVTDGIHVEGIVTQMKFTYDSSFSGTIKVLNKEAVI